MIELRNINLAFGSRTLIENASAHFERGTMVALLGRNGTGKSTLLKAMTSLGQVQGGSIFINGKELKEYDNRSLAKELSFVNTERVMVESLCAYDCVAIGRSPYTNWSGRLTSNDHDIIKRSLAIAGVEHLASRNVDTLSDGEAQRVMIARALAQDTPAILLDEPTSYLDMPNRYELCTLLGKLAHEEGKLVIFSTHELDIALSLADSIALIDSPRLAHLPTEEMLHSGNIERLFNSPYVRFDADTRSIVLRK